MRMRTVWLMLMICLLAGAARAGETGGAEARLADAFKRYDTLGASVAVFQNGRVTFTYTYGQRSPDGPEVTEDTAFQVGSISKMVGCIGLMQLMDAHGLSLDAELGDVLGYPVRNPAFPDEPVTLRQLMTHTASLRDGAGYAAATGGDPPALKSLIGEGGRGGFSGQKPGTERVYSNFGGGLIGSLIEALSGQTLDDYMAHNVFEPLGIAAAYQAARLPEDTPLADIYLMPRKRLSRRLGDGETLVTAPDPEHHYYFTAGKLIVSAPDLCKILIALCDGGVCGDARILKESQAAAMISRQDHIGSVRCESGNGLFLNIITDHEVEGRTLYGHGGKAYGMLCAAYFDPGDRTGVVMLTNGCRNGSDRNGVGLLGREILTLCYDLVIGPSHRVEDPFEVR